MAVKIVNMGLLALGVLLATPASAASCDNVETGYQCQTGISHHWGQYSPYFSVASDIADEVPAACTVTFVQLLERHGARNPTSSKSAKYAAMMEQVLGNVGASNFAGAYAFLNDYTYTLGAGADQLTAFGAQQLVNSGTKFYGRYRALADKRTPFVRASDEERVVASAANWTAGFRAAKTAGCPQCSNPALGIVEISEADGSNNTLDASTCPAFEDGAAAAVGDDAQATFAGVFVPAIRARLNAGMPGANLTQTQTIYFMDLCPFETVASATGAVSPFCALFTAAEWRSYDYYQSLGKYYGHGSGNPLGPAQGIGFVNELVARLTGAAAVVDHTTVNTTLDGSSATFPTGGAHQLFADFSHDDAMTSIFAALGLYNQTVPLSNTTVTDPSSTAAHGYAAAWTVPFGGRAYIEKQSCETGCGTQDKVRVLVNDRVVPLEGCGADKLGRCTLDKFVQSLSFATSGGNWADCYA